MASVDMILATGGSERLFEEARKYAPMGAHGEGKYYDPYPLFIDRAKGARLWDVDGNEYIDYWTAAGPAVLGHSHPAVNEAVKEAMDRHGILFCAPHEWEVRLARRISELVPSGEMSAFACGGSDALCFGVRAARTATGRTKILKFEGSYHGWYDGLLFNVSPDPGKAGADDAPESIPESEGLPPEAATHITILPYNDETLVERLLSAHGREYACIVVEPVMHGLGCITPKPGFLQFLREICDRYGIVLLFDEILTGFRHDVGGAQKLMGVTPDLTAFGKAMSNGFPICALSGNRAIMSHLAPQGRAFFSGTYNGNIMCVAAALKTIDLLADGSAHRKLWALGRLMTEGINAIVSRLGLRARARHYGSIVSLYFSDRLLMNYREVMRSHDRTLNRAFIDWLTAHGIYTKPKRVNRFMLSAAHTEDDIHRTVEVVEAFLVKHQEALR